MKLDNCPELFLPGENGYRIGFDHREDELRRRDEKIFICRSRTAQDVESKIAQRLAKLVLVVSNMKLDPSGHSVDEQEAQYLSKDPLKESPVYWVRCIFHPDVDAMTLLLRTEAIESTKWESLYFQVTVSRNQVQSILGKFLRKKHRKLHVE